jgi:alkylation response protein AidB-like acyl-CoA dehydrogenase
MSATAPSAATSTDHAHFLFSPEHDMFRRTVRRFVTEELDPHTEAWEAAGVPPRSIFEKAGELGFFGITVPEEFGGMAADASMTVVWAEEMGRANSGGVVMGLVAHSEIAMPYVTQFGSDTQKAAHLRNLVLGKKIAALGVTEPGGGSDVAGIRTTARRDGDHWVLNGSKIFITNALNADLFVIAAKTNPEAKHRGMTLFLVPADTPGFLKEEMKGKLGMRSSDTGLLTFDECRLPGNAILGEEDHGFYQIMHCFQNERLAIAGGGIGTAQRWLDQTVRYCQERPMRGQMLSDFQVTKHKLVEGYTQLEAARQLTYYAAWRMTQGLGSLKEISMAKATVTEMVCKVVDDCLQLHGGYGYFSEYGIERAFRDARLNRIGGGATEVMNEIIAKVLQI